MNRLQTSHAPGGLRHSRCQNILLRRPDAGVVIESAVEGVNRLISLRASATCRGRARTGIDPSLGGLSSEQSPFGPPSSFSYRPALVHPNSTQGVNVFGPASSKSAESWHSNQHVAGAGTSTCMVLQQPHPSPTTFVEPDTVHIAPSGMPRVQLPV